MKKNKIMPLGRILRNSVWDSVRDIDNEE